MLEAGVRRGDVVTVYMPMVPELAMVMLACARIGAVHSVVFAGFSAESLRNRIVDCRSRCTLINSSSSPQHRSLSQSCSPPTRVAGAARRSS